jgi:hypothetical protein
MELGGYADCAAESDDLASVAGRGGQISIYMLISIFSGNFWCLSIYFENTRCPICL